MAAGALMGDICVVLCCAMLLLCFVLRAGEHLSVIFVTMLLSGAMPIALFSAAFWFVSSYWCDKAELLKLSRRPVIYGNTLSDHVMNLLPYAAVRDCTHTHTVGVAPLYMLLAC